jgi:hypothetical protein
MDDIVFWLNFLKPFTKLSHILNDQFVIKYVTSIIFFIFIFCKNGLNF